MFGSRPEEADWVLCHVRWLAGTVHAPECARMLPSAVRGAFEARDIVQPAERAALLAVVAELERVRPRDYHPGSHRRVANLIHPSLWPVVVWSVIAARVGALLRFRNFSAQRLLKM